MRKKVKLWKKQEKRIVKLCYKKGLLNDFDLKDLCWTIHFNDYPEIYFWSEDYYGEGDQHGLIDNILHDLFFKELINPENIEYSQLISNFKARGRRAFIRYLKKLPTIKQDSKINKIIRRVEEI